jgi:hypothetical protein
VAWHGAAPPPPPPPPLLLRQLSDSCTGAFYLLGVYYNRAYDSNCSVETACSRSRRVIHAREESTLAIDRWIYLSVV